MSVWDTTGRQAKEADTLKRLSGFKAALDKRLDGLKRALAAAGSEKALKDKQVAKVVREHRRFFERLARVETKRAAIEQREQVKKGGIER